MRFLGNIEAKADAKGRIFLPAAFRKVLQASGENSLVLRRDVFQQCLVLYPDSSWNEQLDDLRSRLNKWSKRDQMLLRQFVADAEQVTLDSNGRFLLPRRYMEMTGITQSVRFIGVDDRIEIWPAELTEEPFLEAEEFANMMEDVMRWETKN